VKRSLTILAQDFLRLADLQFQLLNLDVVEFWQRARAGVVFGVLGAVVTLGAIPVLMFATAEFLRTQAEISVELAQGIVGLTGLVFGGACVGLAIHLFTRAGSSLQRSREELKSNIDWLRGVLDRDDD